jgi:hypothetical protein
MIFRVALSAPNRIVNTQCVATHTHGCFGHVASGKLAFLHVLFADRSSAEPANCSGFLLTLDTFHMRAAMPSNAPNSTTRPTGRVGCNRDAIAGFDAPHG